MHLHSQDAREEQKSGAAQCVRVAVMNVSLQLNPLAAPGRANALAREASRAERRRCLVSMFVGLTEKIKTRVRQSSAVTPHQSQSQTGEADAVASVASLCRGCRFNSHGLSARLPSQAAPPTLSTDPLRSLPPEPFNSGELRNFRTSSRSLLLRRRLTEIFSDSRVPSLEIKRLSRPRPWQPRFRGGCSPLPNVRATCRGTQIQLSWVLALHAARSAKAPRRLPGWSFVTFHDTCCLTGGKKSPAPPPPSPTSTTTQSPLAGSHVTRSPCEGDWRRKQSEMFFNLCVRSSHVAEGRYISVAAAAFHLLET